MRLTSLRARLVASLLTGLLLLALAWGVSSYVLVRHEIDSLLDRQLIDIALSLRRQSLIAIATSSEPVTGEESEVVVQVWDRFTGLAYVSRRDRDIPFAEREGLGTTSWQGLEFRTYTLRAPFRVIQVSQPVQERVAIAARSSLVTLLPIVALMPLIAAIVWLAVRRGLKPVDDVAAAVAARRDHDAEPLPLDRLPDEIRPLATSINRLLARLSASRDAQRRFVADAAHELRSPLTALQLQLSNLERAASDDARREAIAALRSATDRTNRLVQQLLALARLDPEVRFERSPVDLEQLTREVVGDLSPLADARGVDLGIAQSAPARMTADAEGVRLIVRNLVDNAVRYTPPRGRVDVRIANVSGVPGNGGEIDGRGGSGARWVQLEVIDSGPGIPPAERDRVFDRFYRSKTGEATGSGLGLAIVKRAVQQHHGTITLSEGADGKGLRVAVVLPAAPAVER